MDHIDPPIDLADLRKEVASSFDEWSLATERFFVAAKPAKEVAAKAAKKARLSVSKIARQFLQNRASLTKPCLYLFYKHGAGSIEEAVVYVGLVKKRASSQRILDYLAKQISLLDAGLAKMPAFDAEQLIRRRMFAGMSTTAPETCERYVLQHMKSWHLARADSILVHTVDALPALIESAETLLIRSLVEHSREPQHLVNLKKTKGCWPPAPKSLDGKPLALAALAKWEAQNFPYAQQWRQLLEKL